MTNSDPSRVIWRKSHKSNNGGNCVEVAHLTAHVGVRDSKAPDAGYLSFSPQSWSTFVTDVRDGRYDLP